jgi:cysteinyl-tRNA synthetase
MLSIYDSIAQTKQKFTPVNAGKVGIYVCGMTVYDHCHIGHGRGFVVFDVIKRYLEVSGYEVTLVRNITDIDDKIINRAKEHNKTYREWADTYIQSTREDIAALDILPPDFEPQATDHIPEIIALTASLIENNHAYVNKGGDVCFDVRSFKEYGKLSKRDLDNLRAGARVDANDAKRDPLDFVLWKLAKPGEPHWSSPWGDGRPGWHIECSAMASTILGQPFDIHGGGMDLKFPHHENEIAQSEAGCAHDFCNTWMHVGLVQVNSEKMSKSLSNFATIKSVLKDHHFEVLRYFMIAAHYRSPVNYTDDSLHQAKLSLMRLYTAMRGLDFEDVDVKASSYWPAFEKAMDDDFNTPEALAVLFDMARAINRSRDDHDMPTAQKLAHELKAMGTIIGILQADPEQFLQGDGEDAVRIEQLIAARDEARANKDWGKSDQLREELTGMGVIIEDSEHGTTWKKS